MNYKNRKQPKRNEYEEDEQSEEIVRPEPIADDRNNHVEETCLSDITLIPWQGAVSGGDEWREMREDEGRDNRVTAQNEVAEVRPGQVCASGDDKEIGRAHV